MPAGDQGSVQHLTLRGVPVDVLANMFTLFSTIKELKECVIHPSPTRGTVCAHVQCGLGCTSLLYQSLFDSVLIMDVIT